MKKGFLLFLLVCAVALGLCSCQNAEEMYAEKVIRVWVSHTSGTTTYMEYDVYLEKIKEGERYELPHGDANPYAVTVTVTAVEKDGITLQFSQVMDQVNEEKWESEITEFFLSEGSTERFVTPTCGGGDGFAFSIVHKEEIEVVFDFR